MGYIHGRGQVKRLLLIFIDFKNLKISKPHFLQEEYLQGECCCSSSSIAIESYPAVVLNLRTKSVQSSPKNPSSSSSAASKISEIDRCDRNSSVSGFDIFLMSLCLFCLSLFFLSISNIIFDDRPVPPLSLLLRIGESSSSSSSSSRLSASHSPFPPYCSPF